MQHSFDVEIAIQYGINQAIILNNLFFWIQKNKANGKHFYDGHYWTYNSKKAFSELLPYMSERQIDYALSKLVKDGLIIKGNYNKLSYDRTLWYALTNKAKELLKVPVESISQNCKMEQTNLQNGSNEIVQPIPDINSDINSDINKESIREKVDSGEQSSPPPPPAKKIKKEKNQTKHKHGEYENVLLTDEEFEKLKKEFPKDYQERIERLSEYIASVGKSYKNHLATIRSWARKDKPKQQQSSGSPMGLQKAYTEEDYAEGWD